MSSRFNSSPVSPKRVNSSKEKRYLVDSEFIVHNSDINTDYEKILYWMEQGGVKVLKQLKPNVIEGRHGSYLTLSLDPMKNIKKFTFLLNQNEENVIIRMIINPPWYDRLQPNENETIRRWLGFTEELWNSLGIGLDQLYPESLYDLENITNEVHKKWRTVYIGIIFLSLGFMYNTVGTLFFPESELIEYASIFGLITAWIGYIGARQAKKRLVLMEIELKQIPDPNRLLKILTFVVIIILVASEYWSLAAPRYVTFSGYGISFKRNRWWTLETEGLLEEKPDYTHGNIQIKPELDDEESDTLFSLTWVSQEYFEAYFSADSAINFGLSNVFESLMERSLEYEHEAYGRYTRYINGHESRLQNGSIIWSGNKNYYMICWFVCEESDRVIGIMYITQNEFALSYFEVMIETLQCH